MFMLPIPSAGGNKGVRMVALPLFPTTPSVVTPEKPVVAEIPERSSIPPVVPLETSPAPQIEQHNTSGRTPPAPVQIALALVTLIALLWAVASASLSDRRPLAINAIAKTISEARQQNT